MKNYLFTIVIVLLAFSCKKDKAPVTPQPEPPVPPATFIISSDSVIVNPSGYAPLTALVSFTYPTAAKTKIIVHGKNGETSNIEHQFNDEGMFHSIPVIGMYADYSNTVDVILFNADNDSVAKATVQIQTGPLPAGMPASIVTDMAAQ